MPLHFCALVFRGMQEREKSDMELGERGSRERGRQRGRGRGRKGGRMEVDRGVNNRERRGKLEVLLAKARCYLTCTFSVCTVLIIQAIASSYHVYLHDSHLSMVPDLLLLLI